MKNFSQIICLLLKPLPVNHFPAEETFAHILAETFPAVEAITILLAQVFLLTETATILLLKAKEEIIPNPPTEEAISADQIIEEEIKGSTNFLNNPKQNI